MLKKTKKYRKGLYQKRTYFHRNKNDKEKKLKRMTHICQMKLQKEFQYKRSYRGSY